MDSAKIQEIADHLIEYSSYDHVGLWMINGDVRGELGITDPGEVHKAVLLVAKAMLSGGVLAVDGTKTGYHPWEDQDPDRAIERIAKEWEALGRDPHPGEILWFGPEFIFRKPHASVLSRTDTVVTDSGKIDEMIADYVEAAPNDHIGLWQIVVRVHRDLDVREPKANREIVLQVARGIMSAGIPAVTSSKSGFYPWADQDPDRGVARISAEWDALGRDPDLGEIVWFGPEFIFGNQPKERSS